jgi:Fe-S-cluster containining protein
MGLTRSEKDAQLAELYARIPAIPDCDGRCWTSCGPIDMSDRERQRIGQAGVRITPYQQALAGVDRFWCDALTGDKRCAVYELRPLICRIWGAVESMPCVYGCVPEGGWWLSDMDAYRMIAESQRIGGGNDDAGAADADAAMAREELRTEIDRIRGRGMPGGQRRARDGIPAAFRRRSLPAGGREEGS